MTVTNPGGGNPFSVLTNDQIATGQETYPRLLSTGAYMSLTSGAVNLSFFTARKTETENNIRINTGDTAGAGTATYAAMGIYAATGTGLPLTLLAQCASDTTLFTAAYTAFARTLVGGAALVAGNTYALALLVIGAGQMPHFYGVPQPTLDYYTSAPILGATLTGQANLPASIPSGTTGNAFQGALYATFYP